MAKKLTAQELAVAHHRVDSKLINSSYVSILCACGFDTVAHAHEHMTESGAMPDQNALESIADRLHEEHQVAANPVVIDYIRLMR